jgi:CheY-like chemotaxis protein
VLTDIQMPEMDGFRLSEMIRATERGWAGELKCKIVAVTAHIANEIHEKAKKYEIDQVVSKPFTNDHLIQVLKTFWLK